MYGEHRKQTQQINNYSQFLQLQSVMVMQGFLKYTHEKFTF